MKKIFALVMVLLLTLSLLAACGGDNNDSGNGNDTDNGSKPASGDADSDNDAPASSDAGGDTDKSSPKAIKDVIEASNLISLEEAKAIMGLELEANKDKPITTAFIDAARYSLDGISLKVELKQEALYDEETSPTKLKNGWAAHIESEHKRLIKQAEEEQEEFTMTAVPGIGDAAYISDSKIMDHWAIYIIYGEYIIVVGVSPSIYGDPASDAEKASYKEKALEAGKLAADHLKAIVG